MRPLVDVREDQIVEADHRAVASVGGCQRRLAGAWRPAQNAHHGGGLGVRCTGLEFAAVLVGALLYLGARGRLELEYVDTPARVAHALQRLDPAAVGVGWLVPLVGRRAEDELAAVEPTAHRTGRDRRVHDRRVDRLGDLGAFLAGYRGARFVRRRGDRLLHEHRQRERARRDQRVEHRAPATVGNVQHLDAHTLLEALRDLVCQEKRLAVDLGAQAGPSGLALPDGWRVPDLGGDLVQHVGAYELAHVLEPRLKHTEILPAEVRRERRQRVEVLRLDQWVRKLDERPTVPPAYPVKLGGKTLPAVVDLVGQRAERAVLL